MTKHSDFDVAIVGGGPAGLAAGIGFAANKLKTVILEKKTWPIDKACGEGIMPTGVRELDRLGVLPFLENHSYPFKGISLISRQQRRVSTQFADGEGLGVRRTVLSTALHARACLEKSLTLSSNSRVSRIEEEGDHFRIVCSQGDLRCRFLVGADGLRSSLRLKLNQNMQASEPRRYGANLHFEIEPWSPFVEVYFSDGLEAYVTPVGSRHIGIAFLWDYDRFSPNPGKRFLVAQCLERFPSLQDRLRGCETLGGVQSNGPFLQRVRVNANNNVVLIGDAAGYSDAITGEGISIALSEAAMLASRFSPILKAEEHPDSRAASSFFHQRNKMRYRANLTTQIALSTARYPMIQGPVFALLARYPWLLQRLLSFSLTQ